RWRGADLYELLVEWVPYKLSVHPDDAERFWLATVALFGLLHERDLLDPAGDPYSRLVEVALQLKRAFLQAVDPRLDAVPPARPGRGRPVVLDAPLPSTGDATVSAAGSVLLGQLQRFVAHLGDGRRLTARQRLTLADARELVMLLGTGDPVEVSVAGRTFRARSSEHLPGLRLIVSLAKAARWVTVRSGRLVPTDTGRALGLDPLTELRTLLTALLEVGPAT